MEKVEVNLERPSKQTNTTRMHDKAQYRSIARAAFKSHAYIQLGREYPTRATCGLSRIITCEASKIQTMIPALNPGCLPLPLRFYPLRPGRLKC